MTNDEIARFFNTTIAFIQGNPNLRDPQVEGWFRVRQHFRNSPEHAIFQIPVSCSKTGFMALLPFKIAQGRVHVIAPNLEICRGISTAFDVATILDTTATSTITPCSKLFMRNVSLTPGKAACVRGYLLRIGRGRRVKMNMRDTAINALQQAGVSQEEPARP